MKFNIFNPCVKFGNFTVYLWTFVLFAIGFFYGFIKILVIAYGIIAIHEFAHIWVAKRCGVKISSVEILPFGITMKIDGGRINNLKDEIKICLAGPLANFVIAYLVYGFYKGDFREYMIFTSLVMGMFNLLPALPLDGGRILRCMLVSGFGYIRGFSLSLCVTKILSVCIVVSGFLLLWKSGFNFSFLIIGCFLIANITEERKNANMIIMKDILYSRKKLEERGTMQAGVIVSNPYEKASNVLKKLSCDKYYIIYIVDKNNNKTATLTETAFIEAMAVTGADVTMKKIIGIWL